MTKFIIIAVIVTIVSLVAFAAVDRATGAIVDPTSSMNSIKLETDSLSVSITGEVKRAGTYSLSKGTALIDLIEAANGVTTNADPKAYNTEFLLVSGDSYYIAPIYDNSNTCSTSPIEKVNINKADKAALMKVSAFSSTVSAAIIDYRDKNGSFGRIEELKNVTGIGNAIFAKARDFVTLVD